VLAGDPALGAPRAWLNWREVGTYEPLITDRVEVRSRRQQTPISSTDASMLSAIHTYFNETLAEPTRLEACAVEIWRWLAPSTGEVDLTRPWRDGGRDAIGKYMLGPLADRLAVEFALEAKCYAPSNAVGVREMARLISRLRHRQFGVFVTTSYFHHQVYEEVRLDAHPVVLVSGRDIVDTLKAAGMTSAQSTMKWLVGQFPA
jgi:hypothetical protein